MSVVKAGDPERRKGASQELMQPLLVICVIMFLLFNILYLLVK
jgi:hypothetical protein